MFSKLTNKLYTLTYYFSNYTMRFWDILHGTDFSVIDKSAETTERSPYYATPWISLLFLKHYINTDLGRGAGHSVIDIGCGKGFMLYFFSRTGFDRIWGIEYDRRLTQTAEKNLARMLKKSRDIPKVFCEDAVAFENYDLFDTFYLYNPFDRATLEKVIHQIRRSAMDPDRTLYLFYCNPLYDDVLVENGWQQVAHFYYKTRVYVLRGTS